MTLWLPSETPEAEKVRRCACGRTFTYGQRTVWQNHVSKCSGADELIYRKLQEMQSNYFTSDYDPELKKWMKTQKPKEAS